MPKNPEGTIDDPVTPEMLDALIKEVEQSRAARKVPDERRRRMIADLFDDALGLCDADEQEGKIQTISI